MKLERVVIEDFKSIKKLNVTLHELMCFVGKNESGKSSILEAISFLNFPKYKLTQELTNKNSTRYDKDEFPLITGYFELDEVDILEIERLMPEVKTPGNIEVNKINYNFKWFRIKINGNKLEDVKLDFVYGNNKFISLSDRYEAQPLLVKKNEFFNKFIPHIELFVGDKITFQPITLQQITQKQVDFESYERLFAIGGIISPSKLNPGNIEKLSDKLHTASEKITDLFRKNYSQDKSIKINIQYIGTQFLIKFTDSSKRTYSLKEKSLGFQYFFAFLINKIYLNKIIKRQNIFLLDEPGTSLHPEGARDLINIFEQISDNDQVLYTTHNPFLSYRKKPDNLILARKDEQKGTELVTKVYTNKYQILRKELGLLLNDSFLVNDVNLVVEGNADKYILHYLIHEDEDFEPLTWVHIYSADTASEVIPSVRYLNSLDLKGAVLLDSDAAGIKETRKPKFKKYITDSKKWSCLTLDENFKDGAERTIEDMLLNNKYVEAYNEYYKEEDAVEWKKDFEPLSLEKYSLPILDQINAHFKEYADGGINKIAILRKFTRLNSYDANTDSYKDLKNILLEIQSRILKLNN
ncbi:ATP-dependent nuclease [Tenacibaculum aquimarinum]|uniref:ATP-dependent nuclease n=1 Tax=Tenacibaculum aquimarinum TaxID=2910675 RepID=UPI001F0A971D|nr:AAA family ATPase [Tenacibaculum aquimarinum]MCH3881860.1 AAA family ATPase [Tenacibaculum aquimarinum]